MNDIATLSADEGAAPQRSALLEHEPPLGAHLTTTRRRGDCHQLSASHVTTAVADAYANIHRPDVHPLIQQADTFVP